MLNTHTICSLFFFNDTATTEIYTLSLHDALPISATLEQDAAPSLTVAPPTCCSRTAPGSPAPHPARSRSEEHTSELQSQSNLVCRLLLEKKKKPPPTASPTPQCFCSRSALAYTQI